MGGVEGGSKGGGSIEVDSMGRGSVGGEEGASIGGMEGNSMVRSTGGGCGSVSLALVTRFW